MTDRAHTIGDVLREATVSLGSVGVPNGRLDAEVLLAHLLEVERYRLIVDEKKELPAEVISTFGKFIERRKKFEPVAYITGTREFYSLEFHVTPDVLIPRPETELLVDMAIYYATRSSRVLDLCTGSGAIAIALAYSRADLEITATDISQGAISVAKKNSDEILGPGEIEFIQGDLFQPVGGRQFDLILSNPPYVDPDRRSSLQKDLLFEPANALFADKHGTAVIEEIILTAGNFLVPGGMLILEIGEDMKDFVIRKGREAGFDISTLNDHAGLPRVAVFKS